MKNNAVIKLLIFLPVLLFIACSDSTSPQDDTKQLRKEISQMLIIGFRGDSVKAGMPIVDDIQNGRIGGIILFDRDVELSSWDRNVKSPEQVKSLISGLLSMSRQPLYISVDQEGGRVARLKQSYGFPYNVSQQYLGDMDNLDSTRFYGERTANTLAEAGFNVNFAPVVDLNLNKQNPVIGAIERSFSDNPDVVVRHSQVLIDEFERRGVTGTLKHFPGHGSSEADSHLGFVDVTDVWQEIELEPYRRLINAGAVEMIMTAHIFNANLDPDYPATLSHNVLTKLLREELGFQGIIVSDDMNMSAITDHYGLEQAIELSINAGVDILIFANNLIYDPAIATKATDIIINLVEKGKIPRQRITESYNRIMQHKNRFL